MFRAKRADRIKLVFWEGTRLCLFAKRLEDGIFRGPKIGDGVMRLSAARASGETRILWLIDLGDIFEWQQFERGKRKQLQASQRNKDGWEMFFADAAKGFCKDIRAMLLSESAARASSR